MFGDFAVREQVKASYRYRHRDSVGNLSYVLFINFRDTPEVLSICESIVEAHKDALHVSTSRVLRQLMSRTHMDTTRVLRVLRAVDALAGMEYGVLTEPKTVVSFLSGLLQSIAKEYSLDPSDAFGSVHSSENLGTPCNAYQQIPERRHFFHSSRSHWLRPREGSYVTSG